MRLILGGSSINDVIPEGGTGYIHPKGDKGREPRCGILFKNKVCRYISFLNFLSKVADVSRISMFSKKISRTSNIGSPNYLCKIS